MQYMSLENKFIGINDTLYFIAYCSDLHMRMRGKPNFAK